MSTLKQHTCFGRGPDGPGVSWRNTLRSPAMSGRTNSEHAASEHPPDIAEADEADETDEVHDARRARWTAVTVGALLALAGLAASTLRATGSAPALVPAAYAVGALVCGLAAFLGSRGRTRRALWLLIAGVTVMAFGDQFD
ncbi:putative membrane protein [Streptomyces davaonensis JCM 4913]|uniref:Putative membrane protein n=2 Tax=Streptomyces davaonensis TaxID=348043 RepID=K4QTZ9_STRDJ|nr:putative membrane protein [Streptomyces davaonensis JCM 4913]